MNTRPLNCLHLKLLTPRPPSSSRRPALFNRNLLSSPRAPLHTAPTSSPHCCTGSPTVAPTQPPLLNPSTPLHPARQASLLLNLCPAPAPDPQLAALLPAFSPTLHPTRRLHCPARLISSPSPAPISPPPQAAPTSALLTGPEPTAPPLAPPLHSPAPPRHRTIPSTTLHLPCTLPGPDHHLSIAPPPTLSCTTPCTPLYFPAPPPHTAQSRPLHTSFTVSDPRSALGLCLPQLHLPCTLHHLSIAPPQHHTAPPQHHTAPPLAPPLHSLAPPLHTAPDPCIVAPSPPPSTDTIFRTTSTSSSFPFTPALLQPLTSLLFAVALQALSDSTIRAPPRLPLEVPTYLKLLFKNPLSGISAPPLQKDLFENQLSGSIR